MLAAARVAGFRGMQFNPVVETNASAVRLWRSLGLEVAVTRASRCEARLTTWRRVRVIR